MAILLAAGTMVSFVWAAAADDFWKKKPSSQWTAEEALEILQDSPWAQGMAMGVVTMGGASHRWSYRVRWESAGPVEDAFARLEELGERTKALAEAPAPRLPENRYVVTVKVLQRTEPGPDLFDDLSLDTLRKRARLKTRHGEVAAEEAERTGSGAVHFFFVRDFSGKPLLEGGREKVEFHFRGDRFNLKTEFEIRKDDVR